MFTSVHLLIAVYLIISPYRLILFHASLCGNLNKVSWRCISSPTFTYCTFTRNIILRRNSILLFENRYCLSCIVLLFFSSSLPYSNCFSLHFYGTQWTAAGSVSGAVSLVFCLCIWGTAERICAKFTRKTCLVPRSDDFEDQRQRLRSPGTKVAFSALSAVCVRFMKIFIHQTEIQ